MPEASAGARNLPGTIAAPDETCERCGGVDLHWRKCKLICQNCRSIVKSCADL